MELISHSNGRLLSEHLLKVSLWGDHFNSINPGLLYNSFEPSLIKDMLIFHDVGKSSMYFQTYIKDVTNYPYSQSLKSHSLLSAVIFVWYRTQLGIGSLIDHLLAFMAITCHHSCLSSVIEISQSLMSDEIKENLNKQWHSIDKETLVYTLKNCRLNNHYINGLLNLVFDDLFLCSANFLKKSYKEWRKKYKTAESNSLYNLQDYFKLQLLYSLLTDSDKSQTVLENTSFISRINKNIDVKPFMKIKGIGKKQTPLNTLRAQAFNDIDKYGLKVNLQQNRIFLLTLPTGMGKTLSIYNFASILRDRLLKETGKTYRVIYALPFMSIIDQNAKILESILGPHNSHTSMLLKHHHLQPAKWQDEEKQKHYINNDSIEILFEGWNSEIIVTTFVQLLETLIGWTNKKQRKFNKLNNCIIIMDEIQSVPFKYHSLLREIIKQYTKYLDSYFIGMTATQPVIFKDNEALNIIQYGKYSHNLNRITLEYNAITPQTISQVIENFNYDDKKRYLFILNTIASARQMYSEIQSKYPNLNIGYTTTHVPPILRLHRIRKMRQKSYDIVISTQLIEAGVDVDFDVVYRDLAPLPSIVQSAGRSNREGNNKGIVIVIQLISDNGKPFCDQIYGKHSKVDLEETKRLLGEKNEYAEYEIYGLCETYFKNLTNGLKSQDDSFAILRGMERGIFSESDIADVKAVSEFKLIDDNLLAYPVFIEINKHAQKLWTNYSNILENTSLEKWEKHRQLKHVTSMMSRYVVNVNENFFKNFNAPVILNGYFYIQNSQLSLYFNSDTGLGTNNSLLF